MLLCSVCAHPSSSQRSRCKDALYCGAECQRKAWPTHKEICNKVEQLHDAEKTAYAEKLEEKLSVKMIKIAHFDQCVLIEIAATLALNQFQQRYTPVMIINDPLLRAEEIRLTEAKTKAWNDRFAAESAAYLPTLASILWIVAKSGFTEEVAPFLNLSKATRECKNLQRYMREEMNWQNDDYVYTQLHFFCWKGFTASVERMLSMRGIDVEARLKGDQGSFTCLITATLNGHLDICRLLIDKGARLEAKDHKGWTPLCYSFIYSHLHVIRYLRVRGADFEAQTEQGTKPLQFAALVGTLSIVKILVVEMNVEINYRDDRGRTSLWYANQGPKYSIAAYFVSRGGIL